MRLQYSHFLVTLASVFAFVPVLHAQEEAKAAEKKPAPTQKRRGVRDVFESAMERAAAKQGPQLSLSSFESAKIDGSRYRLSVSIKNESKTPYAADGRVVFLREGFGDLLPELPGGKLLQEPDIKRAKLGEQAIPKLGPGEVKTLNIEVHGRASFFAQIEHKTTNTPPNSKKLNKERVHYDWLKPLYPQTGPGFAIHTEKLIQNSKIEEAIHDKLFPQVMIPTQLEISIKDGAILLTMDFIPNQKESEIFAKAFAEEIDPQTRTQRRKINSTLSLALEPQRQLLELKPVTFEVDANWTTPDASKTSSSEEEILKKVDELVTTRLKSRIQTEIIPAIAWHLSTRLRDTLPMFQDSNGNIGKITKMQIEGEQLILHYSIPD